MAGVILLCREQPGATERNLIKLVRFMGGDARVVPLTGATSGRTETLEPLLPQGACVITSAETLSKQPGEEHRGAGLTSWLAGRAANLMVYGFGRTPAHARTLRELTTGSLVGVEELAGRVRGIQVAGDCRPQCGALTGLRFEASGAVAQTVFVGQAEQGNCHSILALDRKPFLVRSNAGDCQVLLLAGDRIGDLDLVVPEDKSLLEFFPDVIPVLMFLRGAANVGFWHNDRPRACFIVDDPLLKRRYGFLDYRKLLEVMDRKRFSTSIAFIPWNHRRSHPGVADLLAKHPRAYSMCVHGCDHTRAEFGSTDRAWLEERAQEALERMNRHREASGVDFDKVMVFPQGIFSTAALSALQSCGYVAAVNSTPYPVDADRSLTLRDLLQVAVTRFSGFPLFTRRYPQKPTELALDLFLGKPAFLVEHHGFFRNGYEALAETVDRLQSMDERIEWGSPETICTQTCLRRVAETGDVHVMFFTNRFLLRNETGRVQKFILTRRLSPVEGPFLVAVNGREAEVRQEAEGLQFEVSLGPERTAEVLVESGRAEAQVAAGRRDAWYQARVFIRRCLSEFRDNYLDLNPFVSRAARPRQ